MELTEIAPDVFACVQLGKATALGWSNSGFVNRGGGLMVDTFMDLPLSRALLAQYATVASAPPARLVNTHHNVDHTAGNQLLPGAEIIGHRSCPADMEAEATGIMAMAAMLLAADPDDLTPAQRHFTEELRPFDLTGIEVTPPTTLIDDRLDLDLDGVAAQIMHLGPAHTASDTVVYLPDRGALFAGDLMFWQCAPVGWEGSTANWIAALDTMISLEPEVVVPGHGPVCGPDGLHSLRDYFVFLEGEAREAYAREIPVFEACKALDLGPYADWDAAERVIFIMDRIYRELAGRGDEAPNAVELMTLAYDLRCHYADRAEDAAGSAG